MKQDLNYSRFVDRYLDGVMSTDERNWFEKELSGDLQLQSELDLQRKIHDTLANKEVIELERQLDSIYKQTYQPWTKSFKLPNPTRRLLTYTAGIAAAAVMVAAVVLGKFSAQTSGADIYASYYQPAEMNMSFRTAEDMVDSDLRSAMILYENKEYEQAISLFEKILKTDDSRIGLHLYSGISHMEIQEYEAANDNFQQIIDHKANAFIESAQWYLGLCYLMTGDTDKAKVVFSEIAESEGYYRKDAKRILKRM